MRAEAAGFLKKYFLLAFIALWVFHFPLDIAQSEVKSLGEWKKGHPKIESALLDLQERYFTQGKLLCQKFAQSRNIRMDEQDRVIVFILPEPGKTKEIIDLEALRAFGVEVIKTGNTIVKAKVPISMLDLIADQVDGISFIKLPDRPHPHGVISQGVNLTGASSYHTHVPGYKGQNVNVAIIDMGFAGLSLAIANGDLPNSVIKIDCTDTSCISTNYSSEIEDHGTAVAEIIHDMAPDAQLYLIKIGDSLDLKDAKDYCIAHGIKIINHSVGWYNSNFYDGSCYYDNPVCTANHAHANGILWVNSAGNEAKSHYEAIFIDRDGDRLHNVTDTNNFIAIDTQYGDVILATLTWNAWPATDQDYDLLLYDSSMSLVSSGATWQSGTQPPSEYIYYFVSSSGTYHLAVLKYNTTTNHKLEIFSLYHDLNPSIASSSLVAPSDATGVMSVAAINHANWTNGPQEDFSSQGPTTDGRIKPEMSGPDGVITFIYNDFLGTSASSPHVAGAAALILSSNPTFNVYQLWDAITSSTVDMGTPGQDNIYGYGRLNLPGFSPAIRVYPSSIFFGQTFVGTSSGTKLVTIQNAGNAPLEIGEFSSTSVHYSINGLNCSNKSLALGESCTVEIRFSPKSGGILIDTFDIPSNDPNQNPFIVSLNGEGIFEVKLLSPSDQFSFNACSLYMLPTFQWESPENFSSYEILFSEDEVFVSSTLKISVYGMTTQKTFTSYQWKKVLEIAEDNGGTVYWRVEGIRPDKTRIPSETRSILIEPPQPVGTPNISPTIRRSLPTLSWQNNCNKKFKVWFSNDLSFIQKSILNLNLNDPTENGGAFTKQLSSGQWMMIRRLVGDQIGPPIYWYIESWDGLNRYTSTEVMNFFLTD